MKALGAVRDGIDVVERVAGTVNRFELIRWAVSRPDVLGLLLTLHDQGTTPADVARVVQWLKRKRKR